MTVPLYDDTGPPLRVQGYCTVWNQVHFCPHPHPHPLRLLPGAADYVGLPVYATFGHAPHMEFADQRDGSLAIWADDYGVAFEAALTTWGCVSLARGVRAGHFREVSCCWNHGRWSVFADEAEGNVETVRKAKLIEVSIVPVAACPGTGCWLDDELDDDLPEHLRTLRAMWHAGRARPKPRFAARAARVQARARAAHQVPASVRAILAQGRPRGWIEAAEALARGRFR
jgi:phage head maturation protease